MDPIYFAKVEFVESVWGNNEKCIMILNLVSKELSYQVINLTAQMPAIQGTESFTFGERWEFQFFNNGELVFTKSGSNAYPVGYGL